MIPLPVPPTVPAQALLPSDRSPSDWHRLATEEIGRNLSPEHAALFATPVPGSAGIAWQAEGDSAVPFVRLPPEDRRLLTAAIGSILSDIRRLVESGRAPPLARLWPALCEVPDQGHIFLVQGRPVLAAWGHRGAVGSLVAGSDDGLAGVSATPPRRRAAGYALPVAAALALLALLTGILVAAGSHLWAAPALCLIDPDQRAAFSVLQQEMDHGNSLRTMLAQLMEETGQRRLQCPIPRLNSIAPGVPQKAGLTETLWDRRDLSVLQGCWNRYTDMTLMDIKTRQVLNVQSWRMCFDNRGAGAQDIVLTNGRSCSGPLTANFEKATLMITEPQPCGGGGGLNLMHGATACQRVSADEAACTRREDEGPNAGIETQSHFRR
jgi:hypothetical protein